VTDHGLPLRGVRVADASTGIAGAYCTKLLADAGADVVSFSSVPVSSGSSRGVLLDWLDASKQRISEFERGEPFAVVVRDQDTPDDAGRAVGRATAIDVVITPFGLTGPWSGRPATEFTLQAPIGVISPRGRTDRAPVMAGGRLGEWAAGSFAATAAVTGLLWSLLDGEAHVVDVSMFECMALSLLVYPSMLRFGFPDPTLGVEIPSIERTADGYVGLCTMTPAQFSAFARMIGRDDWAADEQLSTVIGRIERKDELQPVITAWTSARRTDEVVELAAALRVPATPIGNGASLPTQEPFASRGVFTNTGRFHAPRPAVRFAVRERGAPLTLDPAGARPLAGVRVVDFSAFWAGPFATQYLAAMGADVVKVESARRPDFFRFIGTFPNQDQWIERAAIFHANNTGKRGVTLELDTEDGLALARGLVDRADIVLENFTPRVLDGFGLDHDAIATTNPDALVVRMPAFGLDGPWRDRPGFAQTVEQASGMAWVTGYADDPPRIPRGPGDPLAGMHAAFAALCGVYHRAHGGGGGLIEVPLCDVAVNITVEQVLVYDTEQRLLTRDGCASIDGGVQGVFRCDGEPAWLAVSATAPALLDALRGVIGDVSPEEWCSARPAPECEEILLAAGIPAAVVVDDSRIGANEQLRARGFFETVDHPVAGATELVTWPFRFDEGFARWYSTPAPLLGQHNAEILGVTPSTP
jgi:crotonobetainyl-CoA:carnitine CoA-transferase CaiB-like acyl-CoA transferase